MPVWEGCVRWESGLRLIFISNKPGNIKLPELGDELTAWTDLSSSARYYFIYYGKNKKYRKEKEKKYFIEEFEISLGIN